jgi:hypothetical protein
VNKYLSMVLSLLLSATVGCSDELEPGSLVNKLRVLAVAADQPFALPGQTVNLEALAYDPQQRALSWGWGSCEALESTNAIDCLRQTSFAQLQIGADRTQHTLTIPQTSARYLGVVVVACPGTIQAGSTETLPIACVDAEGNALPLDEFEVGLKRIFVRDSGLNHNPQIQGVSLDGADWTEQAMPSATCKQQPCRAYADQKIVVRADDASEQSVDLQGLPIREQAVVQFYATGGEFDADVKLASDADNQWYAKAEDAGKRITFWLVVRDDRGGVSWVERSLQVPSSRPN